MKPIQQSQNRAAKQAPLAVRAVCAAAARVTRSLAAFLVQAWAVAVELDKVVSMYCTAVAKRVPARIFPVTNQYDFFCFVYGLPGLSCPVRKQK